MIEPAPEDIERSLDGLRRMAGYPVPNGIRERLTPEENTLLDICLEALAEGKRAHPLRIQRSRQKGWRLPDDAVIVDRTSRWGNPYKVKEHGRGRALELYREWLAGNDDLLAQLRGLRGRRLACWCPLDEPCHADIPARLANDA